MHWEVAHTGWSSAGWSEDDPTPEEAMAALASMRPVPAPVSDPAHHPAERPEGDGHP